MGYRSSFKLSVSDKGKKIIDKKLSKWIEYNKDEEDYAKPFAWEYENKKENHYILGGEHLKMYNEFEEIKLLKESMREMYDNEISYHYIRLGEDVSDIEEDYSENEDDEIIQLDLYREISY